MSLKPKKRSLTLRGHRTSVSLEDRFWTAFRQIAADENLAINALAAKV
ncbi:MAG: ribbon-helix-helix domain-containing protein, partial [Paracoccaceae bacterium]